MSSPVCVAQLKLQRRAVLGKGVGGGWGCEVIAVEQLCLKGEMAAMGLQTSAGEFSGLSLRWMCWAVLLSGAVGGGMCEQEVLLQADSCAWGAGKIKHQPRAVCAVQNPGLSHLLVIRKCIPKGFWNTIALKRAGR